MSYKTFRILMLILLVIAPPAVAWDVVPGSGAGDCKFSSADICFEDFDADESSAIIDTRPCENWTAHWDSLITGTTHLNTINLRWSVSPTASANTSEIVDNKTLTGDPATGLDVLAGFDAPWVYADIAAYTAGTGRLSLQCWKRK